MPADATIRLLVAYEQEMVRSGGIVEIRLPQNRGWPFIAWPGQCPQKDTERAELRRMV